MDHAFWLLEVVIKRSGARMCLIVRPLVEVYENVLLELAELLHSAREAYLIIINNEK